jgi:hypothetical protein
MVCCLPVCCLPGVVKYYYFWLLRTFATPISILLLICGISLIGYFSYVYFLVVVPLLCVRTLDLGYADGSGSNSGWLLYMEVLRFILTISAGVFLLGGALYTWLSMFRGDPGFLYIANRTDEALHVNVDIEVNLEANLWQPQQQQQQQPQQQPQQQQLERRFCNECAIYKTKGTHHCRVCNRCVAAYDHHCPVLGTCVGQRNHGRFLVLLFYVGLGSLYTAMTAHLALHVLYGRYHQRDLQTFYHLQHSSYGMLMVVRVVAALVGFGFSAQFLWWLYAALMGLSVIDLALVLAKRQLGALSLRRMEMSHFKRVTSNNFTLAWWQY